MTTSPGGSGVVPEWTLGDRLRKARDMTGLKSPAFAALIEVSTKTVNNAESGKHAVRPITLKAWALATGVSRKWLETGEGEPTLSPDPGIPAARRKTGYTRLAAQKTRHAGRSATHQYGERAA